MDSKTKFTKGDWDIAEGKTYCAVKQKDTGIIVADMRTVNGSYQRHDAHLIKTAPKLYAEIEGDIKLFESMAEEVGGENGAILLELANAKRLLLAEARGEA